MPAFVVIMLWLVGGVLVMALALLALLMVLLCIPAGLRITGAPAIEVEARWLFDIVRFPLRRRNGSRNRDSRDRGPGGQGTRRRNDGQKRRRGIHGLSPTDLPLLFRALTTLIRRMVRRFQVSGDGNLGFGLPDPADTGMVWGTAYPLFQIVTQKTGLQIYPVFTGAALSFSGQAAVYLVPVTLFVPVIQFLFSREGRVVIRMIRRDNG